MAFTLVPGVSLVPRALRTMFLALSFSMQTVSYAWQSWFAILRRLWRRWLSRLRRMLCLVSFRRFQFLLPRLQRAMRRLSVLIRCVTGACCGDVVVEELDLALVVDGGERVDDAVLGADGASWPVGAFQWRSWQDSADVHLEGAFLRLQLPLPLHCGGSLEDHAGADVEVLGNDVLRADLPDPRYS